VPFRADTPLAVLMKHVNDPLPPPRSLNPDLPEAMERVILKALAKSPEDRFARAGDLVRALQEPTVVGPTARAGSAVTTVGAAVRPGPTIVGPGGGAAAKGASGTGGRRRGPLLVGCVAVLGIVILGGAAIGILSSLANRGQPTEVVAAATTAPTAARPTAVPPTAAPLPGAGYLACQVTDTGGIDDKSFNATAWKGIEDAVGELGIEGKFLESQQQTDYEANINAFLEENCDIIVTVGFLLGDATAAGATANPDTKFSIVDFAYDPTMPNVLGQVFSTNEAAFLAGYAAAATTQTGKIGTFGGIQIPPVTVFMDGFALGAAYYNQQHGTNVEVLGWDPATQTGLFTGNFESTDDGRAMGESLMDEGADIIMPVAGPVGLGTAAAVQERGNAWIVGVDNDWSVVNADYADVILTSVLKNMDVTTLAAIKSAMDGTFAGGVTVGNLANGGVGLAPLTGPVPSGLQAELDQVRADIIAGTIPTSP
jgi:basic membrane protein A